MAYLSHSVTVQCPTGTILQRIKISGTWFNLTPFAITLASPTVVTDVDAILNAVVPTPHFGVVANTGSGTLTIRNTCNDRYTVDEIDVLGGGESPPINYVFSHATCIGGFSCSNSVAIVATLNFDCDTQEVTFTDTTGDASATNTGGYSTGNGLNRSQIMSADFVVTDTTTVLGVFPTDYVPNADGTSSINFSSTDFGIVSFAPNTTVFIEYRLNLINGTQQICLIAELLIPCCGGSVTSNNVITYSILQKIGCTTFELTDSSGVYDVDTNPGGYGNPNWKYADITSTLIRITRDDGTVYDITDFIPTESVPTRLISGWEIGYGSEASPEVIPSQVMTVEYYVYIGIDCLIGYYIRQVLFDCQLKMCIRNRAIEVLQDDCANCENKSATDVTNQLLQYQALLIVAETNVPCIKKPLADLLFDCLKGCNGCE